MRKRIPLTFLVLFFLPAGRAPGDVAAQFQQAEQLTSESKYEQAESIYSQIATERPGTADGLRAQQKLTALYVGWGKQTDAQASLDKLLTQYSQHELLPEAVTKVGDAYRKAQSYAKAAEIHRYVVDRWPNNEFAFWSQMDLVMCSEALRDVAGAQAAFEKLCTQYSGHQLMPKAICFLGDDYRRRGQHARALELYGQVLSNWPKAEDALWSQMGLAISSMLLGDIDAADAATAKLHIDFSENNRMSIAACLVGDEYRKSGQHLKACDLYQYVLSNHPNSEHAFWSQMNLVLSNIHLGREDAAEEALGKLFAYSAKKDDRLPYAIRTVADEYRGAENYGKAFELYERVIRDYPDTKDALWSQMNIAISNIRLENDDEAAAAVSRLLASFSRDSDIHVAVCWVADQYRASEKHQKACELYQHVVDNRPDTEHAMWSQVGLAISSIELGNDATAEAALGQLLARHVERNGIEKAISSIARHYEGLHEHEKSDRVYQTAMKVLSNRPQSERGLWSRVAAVVCDIGLGNEADAQAVLDEIFANFDDHPDLPLALWRAADAYYYHAFEYQKEGLQAKAEGYFARVISLGERIRQGSLSSNDTVEAYYFSGICHELIGQQEKAVECYQRVADSRPDHDYAWSALYRIGRDSEKLVEAGLMPKSEADPVIRAAYEQLLRIYPNCGGAKHARRWLERNKSTR